MMRTKLLVLKPKWEITKTVQQIDMTHSEHKLMREQLFPKKVANQLHVP